MRLKVFWAMMFFLVFHSSLSRLNATVLVEEHFDSSLIEISRDSSAAWFESTSALLDDRIAHYKIYETLTYINDEIAVTDGMFTTGSSTLHRDVHEKHKVFLISTAECYLENIYISAKYKNTRPVGGNFKAFVGERDIDTFDSVWAREIYSIYWSNKDQPGPYHSVLPDGWFHIEITQDRINEILGDSPLIDSINTIWIGEKDITDEPGNGFFDDIYISGDYVCPDTDNDGVYDYEDNCPLHINAGQEDADADEIGDTCDSCPNDPENFDSDDDGVCDDADEFPDDPAIVTPPILQSYGKIYLDTSANPGTFFTRTFFIQDNDPNVNQDGKPEDMRFKHGLVTYIINGVEDGDSVEITMTFPEKIPNDAVFYKINENGFYQFNDVVTDGFTATITLTDGGPEDADNEVNGEIHDPIGMATPNPIGTATPFYGSSSSCFIATAANDF